MRIIRGRNIATKWHLPLLATLAPAWRQLGSGHYSLTPSWHQLDPSLTLVFSFANTRYNNGNRRCIYWSMIQLHPMTTTTQSCPRVGWTRGSGRVRSGRVTILPDFGGSGRSGQHFGFFSFLLIISWYLNRRESSNSTLGFIDIWYNN